MEIKQRMRQPEQPDAKGNGFVDAELAVDPLNKTFTNLFGIATTLILNNAAKRHTPLS